MIDLRLLQDNRAFSMKTGAPRLALVHHGFRTTQLGLMDKRALAFTGRYAALGLLNLARSVEVDFENGRIPFAPEVRYFDEDAYVDDDEMAAALTEWLKPAPARFLLVGLYSLAMERTAGLLVKVDPTTYCIVVGGAHPTVAPQVD